MSHRQGVKKIFFPRKSVAFAVSHNIMCILRNYFFLRANQPRSLLRIQRDRFSHNMMCILASEKFFDDHALLFQDFVVEKKSSHLFHSMRWKFLDGVVVCV